MSKKDTQVPLDISELPMEDDTEARQFVLRIGEHRVRMEYDRSSDRIFLTNLHVPRALVDQGVGDAFTEKVLQWVEDNGLKVVPTHPIFKEFLRRNTSWQRLLLKGVQLR
jgi:predicted GNAT family acetyltransferase